MSLLPRDAFKVGFLQQCAAEALTPEQMLQRIKAAKDVLEKKAGIGDLVSGTAHAAGGLVKTLGSYAIPIGLAAPPVLGGLAGYGLAKATDLDDTDVDDIKNRELVEEYQRQAERLKGQKQVRDFSKEVQRTGRVFM